MSNTIVTAAKFWIIKRHNGLAYMSIIDKGHPKRKETGIQWANNFKYEWDRATRKHVLVENPPVELEFDNDPVTGIEIIESHERYSTSNQVMQLRDPRGFEVQIYINNLTSILKNVTIENGIINTPLKWGRRSGNIYLMIPVESSEALTDNDKRKLKDIPEGEMYTARGANHVYIGERQMHVKGSIYKVDVKNSESYEYGHDNRRQITRNDLANMIPIDDFDIKFPKKPLSITKLDEDSDSWISRDRDWQITDIGSSVAVPKSFEFDQQPSIQEILKELKTGNCTYRSFMSATSMEEKLIKYMPDTHGMDQYDMNFIGVDDEDLNSDDGVCVSAIRIGDRCNWGDVAYITVYEVVDFV